MATIVKRDGSEVQVAPKPLSNQDLKSNALRLIADFAVFTEWEETQLGDGRIKLRLECVIEKSRLK